MLAVIPVLILCSLTGLFAADDASHPCRRPCLAGQTRTCRFNFTIEWYRTMSKACYSCPFNVTDCYREECVSADGKIRPILTVNRQLPGPPIEVCVGDVVEVAVTNHLENGLTTSMHWHGQHVLGAPYFDGVGQITQCNIQFLETFLYQFKAGPAGTHWYHPHTGMQLADGAFGPLIVREPSGMDPNDNLYDEDLSQHTVMLYDWLPELSLTRHLNTMHVFDVSLPRSIMVNGRARMYNVTDQYGVMDTQNMTEAQTPLEVLRVRQGVKYRLRFISAAPTCSFQVSVDGHQLMVISVDGQPVEQRVLDAFIIHPGARYDFVLDASNMVNNYWLRIIGFGDCRAAGVNGKAIVRYEGALDEDPKGDPNIQRDGILLNPILYDGSKPMYGYNRTVISVDDMRSLQNTNYTNEVVDYKYFIGMDYNQNDNSRYNDKDLYPVSSLPPAMTHLTPVMDNITFMVSPVPLLSQPQDIDPAIFCNRSTLANPDFCYTEDLCMCTHVIHFPLNKVVELVVFHEGRLYAEIGHNIHLHGHSFRLLGVEKVSPSVSRSQMEDLDKRGLLKRNYINPPLMDTINIPDGGYAVFRITTNNPGFWFFHCHVDSHLQQGMALLIRVGEYSDLPPVPKEFPRCGGMGYSNARTRDPVCATGGVTLTQLSTPTLLTLVVITFLANGLF